MYLLLLSTLEVKMQDYPMLPAATWVKANYIVSQSNINATFEKRYWDLQYPCGQCICPCREEQEISMFVKKTGNFAMHIGTSANPLNIWVRAPIKSAPI